MMQMLEKGYVLNGTAHNGVYVVTRNANTDAQHAVFRTNYWGELNRETEWMRSKVEAESTVTDIVNGLSQLAVA